MVSRLGAHREALAPAPDGGLARVAVLTTLFASARASTPRIEVGRRIVVAVAARPPRNRAAVGVAAVETLVRGIRAGAPVHAVEIALSRCGSSDSRRDGEDGKGEQDTHGSLHDAAHGLIALRPLTNRRRLYRL
jgi:hypothetical protein